MDSSEFGFACNRSGNKGYGSSDNSYDSSSSDGNMDDKYKHMMAVPHVSDNIHHLIIQNGQLCYFSKFMENWKAITFDLKKIQKQSRINLFSLGLVRGFLLRHDKDQLIHQRGNIFFYDPSSIMGAIKWPPSTLTPVNV